uniref:hypothetical protein n=1 Tax=Mariniphaga sediminis TaxID=1628158 RepID=UPI003561387D
MLKIIKYIFFAVCIIGLQLVASDCTQLNKKIKIYSPPNHLSMISSEPMFWSRIGFTQNPTRLDSSGNPLFYDNDFSTAIRENSAFEKAGVKIFTSIIHNGWTGVNKYNYTAVDSTLNILLKGHPDRYYLPRIKLDVPTEWALENPEDLFVNFYGPRDKNDILTLAEKLEKYWDTAGWSGGVPVNEGLVGLQSFSSAKWKEDAGKALKRLIKH